MKAIRLNPGTKFLLIVSFATLVASCGGGGGGDASQPPTSGGGSNPPPPAITGSITSVSNAEIPLGTSSGQSMVAWTSNATQPGDVRVRVNGVEVSTQPASPQSGLAAQVGNGEVKVELVTASGQILDTKTAIASCAMGQWQGGVCAKFGSYRLDLVVESVKVMPFSSLKDGVATELVNRTGYVVQAGAAYPLGNCGVYDLVRAEDNAPLVSCTTIAAGNLRRTFPVNPATLELLPEYTGPLPAGATLIGGLYGTFGDSPYASFSVGQSGMYLDVPGYGTYYYTNDNQRSLRLTRDGFLTSTEVMSSLGIKVLYSFSTL
jgi:hypothetical protein